MNKVFAILSLTIILVVVSGVCLANSAPVVSNVLASQRADDSKLVDIYYDLADADGDNCSVWVIISGDGGLTWTVPAFTFSGDRGASVAPGTNKHVIWDAGHDIPGKIGTLRARVYADDGKASGDMVLVPGGVYLEDGISNNWVDVNSFYIDRYETTIKQYVEFLNATDPNGARYHPGMSSIGIIQTGTQGYYTYYLSSSERENYPVEYVSFDDTTAFAQWKSSLTGLNYSLPTKQQWQKAAAWDPVENKFYLYGCHRDEVDCTWVNFGSSPYGCVGHTTPVGYYNGTGGRNDAKSYYGCYDMSGNVFELTSEANPSSCRILRGGVYNLDSSYCLTTAAGYACPWLDPGSAGEGFRLVREP